MDQDPDAEQRRNWIVLGLVIVLVALTIFLLLKLKSGIARENCIAQGRHDCVPVDDAATQ